jgi:two-component system response regulator AtoC
MKVEARWSDQSYTSLQARLAELEHRTHFLRHALNGLPDQIQVIDGDLNSLFANCAPGRTPADGVPESRGKCYHQVGREGPCEGCPAFQGLLSAEHPYALMVQAVQGSDSEETRPPCVMLSAIPASASSLVQSQDTVSLSAGATGVAGNGASEENRLGSIIGRSDSMRRLFDMIRLVAGSDATVLLEGESGTGKEMVARTIHRLSGRQNGPFVVIDCGALPETLLESELFGHMRGAFTGAVVAKRGLLEEAHEGTIFLDEIADMSPALQAKLLRVIQEGEIRPVGGSRRVKVNVRVISASNQALAPLVAAKAFREDLFYRLAVIPIIVPPLRQRREDIPLLVNAFVSESCARYGRSLLAVPPEAMRLLTNHPWPGNVRELRHLIERAVLTASGSELAADRLFGDLMGKEAPATPMSSLKHESQDAVRLLERARILAALSHTNGNRAWAARWLKISRASFYNKLRDYQIQPSERARNLVEGCPATGETV